MLVEAFLPRERRYVAQSRADAGRACVVALVGTGMVATDLPSLGDGVGARHASAPRARSPLDGPTVFLWGLILVFGLGGVLLFAERRLEGGVSAFAGQAAALPGTEAERQARRPASTTPRSTR